MTKPLNRVRMTTATTGTGTITLGSAVTGFQTFSSGGVANNDVYTFVIEDGTAWEISNGTYSTTGPTLTRTLIASSTGSLLSLSGTAQVFPTAVGSQLGLWSLQTQNPSAAATADFTSGGNNSQDWAQFRAIKFIGLLKTSVVDASLGVRVSTDGGSTWLAGAANYKNAWFDSSALSVNASGGGTDTWANHIAYSNGTNYASFEVMLAEPSATGGIKQITWQGGYCIGTNSGVTIGASQATTASTSAITGVRFLPTSGTITGTVSAWGVL